MTFDKYIWTFGQIHFLHTSRISYPCCWAEPWLNPSVIQNPSQPQSASSLSWHDQLPLTQLQDANTGINTQELICCCWCTRMKKGKWPICWAQSHAWPIPDILKSPQKAGNFWFSRHSVVIKGGQDTLSEIVGTVGVVNLCNFQRDHQSVDSCVCSGWALERPGCPTHYELLHWRHCALWGSPVHCRMQMCYCTERLCTVQCLNVACSTVLHFCPRSAPAKLEQWSLSCSALICTIHPAHETPDNGGTHQPVTDSHVNALPHIRPMFAFPRLVSIMLRSYF